MAKSYDLGAVTAYATAVEHGYEGTEEQFAAEMTGAAQAAREAAQNASDAEAYAVGKRNGTDVPSTDPTYQNNAKYWAEHASGVNLAQDFSTSTDYGIDDYVLYNNKLYRFTVAHIAGAWNSSHVVEVKTMDEVSDLKGDLNELILEGYSLSPGYITTNGDIHVQTEGRGELYTSILPIYGNDKFRVVMQSVSSYEYWLAYALYDSNKNFIERLNPVGTVVTLVDYWEGTLEITNTSAKYIAFTYRAYSSSVTLDIYKSVTHLNGEVNNMVGSGLTDEIKEALLNCFKCVAWDNVSGEEPYNALKVALGYVETTPLYSWDFTKSLVDSVNGYQASLIYDVDVLQRTSAGVVINNNNQAIQLLSEQDFTLTGDITVQIEFGNVSIVSGATENIRLLVFCDNEYSAMPNLGVYATGIVYRKEDGLTGARGTWTYYNGKDWAGVGLLTGKNAFSNKTLSIYFDSNKKPTIYLDGVKTGTSDIYTTHTLKGMRIGDVYVQGHNDSHNKLYTTTIKKVRIYSGEVY